MSANSASVIRADEDAGVVTWEMSGRIATFYAFELAKIAGRDEGVRDDVLGLLWAVGQLRAADDEGDGQ